MSKTIPTEVRPDKTSVSILSYIIEPVKKSLHVNWAKGYMDESVFVPVESFSDVIDGDDYDTLSESMGDDSKSLKEQFEDKIYAWLVAEDKVTLS